MKLSPIPGTVKRTLGVASHLAALSALGSNDVGAPVPFGSGRSLFSPLHQRGALSASLAFNDDALLDEPMQEAAFQSRVLGEIGTFAKKSKETLEEITQLKKTANDQQANINRMGQLIRQHEVNMRNEKRLAYGDPIRRISEDDEMRTRFNIALRLACSKGTELISARLADQCKEITGHSIKEISDQERRRSINNLTGKALGEDSSPGSNLIDDRLSSEIYDTLSMFGIWNSFQVVPVGAQTTKFPVTTARPTASFILTEAGTVSDGSFTGTSVSNVMEVIAALINISLQLLEDSETDLTGYVMEQFSESFAERLDHACLNADGTADGTNGGMTGIFQGGTAATADAGAGADDTVEELEFEDWTRCLLTVDPVVLQRAARWWMHPQILIRALSVKDLNGRPLFLTALEAPAPQSLGSILGYPVTPAMKAPNTNSASQKVAVFGDPRGMVVGLRRSFTFEASDHARWTTLERSFRGWGRAGTKIRRALSFAVLTLGA